MSPRGKVVLPFTFRLHTTNYITLLYAIHLNTTYFAHTLPDKLCLQDTHNNQTQQLLTSFNYKLTYYIIRPHDTSIILQLQSIKHIKCEIRA